MMHANVSATTFFAFSTACGGKSLDRMPAMKRATLSVSPDTGVLLVRASRRHDVDRSLFLGSHIAPRPSIIASASAVKNGSRQLSNDPDSSLSCRTDLLRLIV